MCQPSRCCLLPALPLLPSFVLWIPWGHDPWGHARHTSHAHYQSVPSPLGATFPTVLRSFHFSFIHLVKKQLLGTDSVPGTNC